MARQLEEKVFEKFSSGLNTEDSTLSMADSDLETADNVKYYVTGEVVSIDGLLKSANNMVVNGVTATKTLGATRFNGSIYAMVSNGTEARLLKKGSGSGSITVFADGGGGQVTVTSTAHGLKNNDDVTISGTTNYNGDFTVSNITANTFEITTTWVSDDATGTWSGTFFNEAVATNFDPDANVSFQVYADVLWFVNGQTTGSNILHFLSTSDVLTGLSAASSGLPAGINNIVLHLERMWISHQNRIFVSIQYPTGAVTDWNASDVYSGSQTAGLIQLDNNSDDSIYKMVTQFAQLVVFRQFQIHTITGKTVLTSTIHKAFNTSGVVASRSIARADKNIYFLSRNGIKLFSGISVQEGTTEFDSVQTDSIDRKIKSLIDGDDPNMVGYAFKDKYYVTDRSAYTYVFDEIVGAWSRWSIYADEFIDDAGDLYLFQGATFSKIDASPSASVSSTVRTKDFNMGTNYFYKEFYKALLSFTSLSVTGDVTVNWYLNGLNDASGTWSITIPSKTTQWDSGYSWDQPDITWDAESINFFKFAQRKLKIGNTIAFEFIATGANRFALKTIDLVYELLKREVS